MSRKRSSPPAPKRRRLPDEHVFHRNGIPTRVAQWGTPPTSAVQPTTEFLIWSHHHQMWFAPKGCGYRRDIVDAGRFAVDETQQWLGRGCGCCAVPEVVIPAPGPEVFAEAGKVGEWATKAIKASTDARFAEGKINNHAAVLSVPSETGSDQQAVEEN